MVPNKDSISLLVTVAVGLCCTAALTLGVVVWWLRSEAIKDASENASNIAVVLAEQTNRSVKSIDIMFNEVQERIEALGARTVKSITSLPYIVRSL